MCAPLLVGQEARLVFDDIHDTLTGDPAIPDALTVTFMRPDGTIVPTVETLSLGVWSAVATVDVHGLWKWRAIATGAVVGAGEGTFVVDPSAFP